MKKETIIRHIQGLCSIRENREVMEWIKKSPDNLSYYVEQKNLFVIQTLPDKEATHKEISEIMGVIKRRGVNRYYIYAVAASIVLLLTISLNIFQYIKYSNSKMDTRQNLVPYIVAENLTIPEYTFYTNKGVKGIIYLPDSSKVWMNSDTKITFPKEFKGKYRNVSISGEAFFDVVSNANKPMIVSTSKGLKIEVLGTEFSIRSYDNDDEAQATLYKGIINLISSKNESSQKTVSKIVPSQSVICKNNIVSLVNKADTSKIIAWKNGYLIFEQTPLNEVVKQLERWHGNQFVIKDPSILKYKFTAKFKSESIVQILEMLRFSTPIDFRMESSIVYLSKR